MTMIIFDNEITNNAFDFNKLFLILISCLILRHCLIFLIRLLFVRQLLHCRAQYLTFLVFEVERYFLIPSVASYVCYWK